MRQKRRKSKLARAIWARCLVGALTLNGCIGIIGDEDVGSGDTSGTGADPAALCDAGIPNVGYQPLRRLTRAELRNALRDLLELDDEPDLAAWSDDIVAGFRSSSATHVSQGAVESVIAESERLAVAALQRHRDDWLDCDITSTDCVKPWLERIGRRAFRRPLDPELETGLVAYFEDARDQWGADRALELLLTTIVASPHFLYHLDASPADDGAVIARDGYEVAEQLSFFLWQSLPDDALLDAAATGELETAQGVEAQARRLLSAPEAEATIRSFYYQWLDFERLFNAPSKDADLYPDWSPALAAKMQEETLQFASHIVTEGRPATELLTADYTFADSEVAQWYGTSASEDGDAFERISLPPERRGLLTHGSFLASHAHSADASWTLRGHFVRDRLLCQKVPPPPPDVDDTSSNDLGRLEDPNCSYCHELMDPIGWGFDRFGAAGEYQEDGSNDTGRISPTTSFDSPVELSEILASHADFGTCVTTQWARFATGREADPNDLCAIEKAQDRFTEGDLDIRELLVALASSDLFRYRRGPEGDE